MVVRAVERELRGESRRHFLLGGAVFGLVALGCKPAEFTCTSASGLSPADKRAREALGYADHAADPARTCQSCQQWETRGSGCGACRVMAGPIHPLGTCSLFAARA